MTKRKTKLKTMKRKVKLEKRIVIGYKNAGSYDKEFKETLPVLNRFDFNKNTQDWTPKLPNLKIKYYVPKKISNFCEYLKDLFCIQEKIILDIRYQRNNMAGICYRKKIDDHKRVLIGGKTGIRATTLVHEFLHAAGFNHENNINGYSDYSHRHTKDTYSPLIVKDIFGKKEVLLN